MLITPSEFMDFISRVTSLLYWAKFLAFIICITVVIGFIAPKGKRWWIVTLTIMIASAGYIIPDIIKLRERQVIVKKEIYRTVDNVEGITLLRIRKPYRDAYAYDPMWEEAALQRMSSYIYSFLGVTHHDKHNGYYDVYWKPEKNEKIRETDNPLYGYQFVDVKKGKFYLRYALLKRGYGKDVEIISENISNPARYAVTYETKVDPNERKYWIAGTTIKIIDTKDNSLLAEKTIYVFDHGLGAGAERKSGRQPWSLAIRCPNDKVKGNAPRFFAEKVLKPKQPNFN